MSVPEQFPAFVVSHADPMESPSVSSKPKFDSSIRQVSLKDLDAGDVVVKVSYSALNYKDALAATGQPGVAQKFPLIPGIDAVGVVIESDNEQVSPGDQVFVAHAKFGTAHNGGLSAYVRVPGDWVYRLPPGLTMMEAATWGTAGFTAAQSVEQLVKHGIDPESGDILVTGATGGVGIFAVGLLSKLGYRVVASSGKKEKHDWLKKQGAAEVITREETLDDSIRPLLKSRWAGAIDSVGGATLASVLRSAKPQACVTACGLVAGHDLELTVYPFILRGVTLCGIDSANISRETRSELWNKIASQWRLDVTGIVNEVAWDGLPQAIDRMLAGKVFGRTIINIAECSQSNV